VGNNIEHVTLLIQSPRVVRLSMLPKYYLDEINERGILDIKDNIPIFNFTTNKAIASKNIHANT